jgi:hypothetical protein
VTQKKQAGEKLALTTQPESANKDKFEESQVDVNTSDGSVSTKVGAVNLSTRPASRASIQLEIDKGASPSLPAYDDGEESPYVAMENERGSALDKILAKDLQDKKTFSAAFDGSLGGLAYGLRLVPGAGTNLKDDVLIQILKESFQFNWFRAKECLITESWGCWQRPTCGSGRQLILLKIWAWRPNRGQVFVDGTRRQVRCYL